MTLKTPQEIHPLGGVTARGPTLLSIAVSGLVIGVGLITGRDEITVPSAAVLSVLAFVGASALLLRATSPFHAPFDSSSHVAIVGLLAVMLVGETLSTFGQDVHILSSYGYLVTALFMFPLGSYRPPISVALTAGGLAPLIIALAYMRAPFVEAPFSPTVLALATVAPTLAVGAASATFSRHLVVSLSRELAESSAEESRALAARVTPLALIGEEVLPLLERVALSGQLTEADSDAARELGGELRRILVAESDASGLPEWRGQVDDPHKALSGWSMRQRTGLLALAEALSNTTPPPRLDLVVSPTNWTFRAEWDGPYCPRRSWLAGFAAKLGVVFGGVVVQRRRNSLVVRNRTRGPL